MSDTSRLARRVGSVRFRITALATVFLVVALALAGVALTTIVHRLLVENATDAIEQRSDDAARVLADTGDPTLVPGGGDLLIQVVGPDSRVYGSGELRGTDPIAPDPGAGRAITDLGLDVELDDRRFRVLSRRVDTPEGPAILHVAGTLDDADEAARITGLSLVGIIPVLAVVLAGLVWWLVGRTLASVEAIRSEVAEIDGSDLARRVPRPPGHDEIARLADTMNHMLERVQDATARQQRFVADASHELRSPLTRIRTELEVDLAATPGAEELAATHRSVLEETVGLQRLVEDLLHLARSDAGVSLRGREPVDLDDVVLREARRLRESHPGLVIDTTDVGAAQVIGDRDQLMRAVRNLAHNAATHTTSRVALSCAEVDGRAVVAVIDDGPGIAGERHAEVFERFGRLDEARTTSSGGAGLGLAITRDIATAHDGTVVIDPDHAPGARLVMSLPLAN